MSAVRRAELTSSFRFKTEDKNLVAFARFDRQDLALLRFFLGRVPSFRPAM
jgi:hypothetical protein